jgi:hypothetical protein
VARADRTLAFLAFLLAVTALWLPWWRVSWDDGSVELRQDVAAFRPEEPLTTSWAPWLTGLLCAAAAVLLFVRVAANSHLHEPTSWRRDLGVSAGLLLIAVASCLLWPSATPSFWGGRTYTDGGVSVTETAIPGLGWWVAVVAAALAALAFWQAGKARPTDELLPSDAAGA